MLKSVSLSLKLICLIGCLVLAGAASPLPLLAQVHVTPLLDGMVIGLRADNGLYVGADPGKAAKVVADRPALDPHEQFTVVSKGYNKFAFKANANNKFISVDPSGATLLADADAVAKAQTFYVIYHGESLISLKADANQKYVKQNQINAGRLEATADAINDWEKFVVVSASATLTPSTLPQITPLKDGMAIGLKSDQGKYWISDFNQRTEVLARSDYLYTWETFTVKDLKNNKIALIDHRGKYLRADLHYDGRFLADSDDAWNWETFEVFYHGDNEISLKAEANNKIVGRNPDELNRLQAVGNLTDLTGAYRFTVETPPLAASTEYEPLMAAIETYAPQAIFQRDENYFPCSAEAFIEATKSVNATDPANGYLEITDETIKQGRPQTAKAYVNLVTGPIFTDIQYWFLYGYNGPGTGYSKIWVPFSLLPPRPPHYESLGDMSLEPAGSHEGDWEHITVRIRNDNYKADRIYYAWHDDGTQEMVLPANQNNRIVFYVSKNGHAAYATAERHYPRFVDLKAYEFRLVDDTSNPNPDTTIDFRGNWALIGAHLNGAERTDFLARGGASREWMKYTGRWGRVREGKLGIPAGPYGIFEKAIGSLGINEFDEDKGPSPPWTKSSWTKPEF